MTGYHAVLLQRHDVADRQAVAAKILRAADVEGLIQLVQPVLRIAPAVEAARVDGGVILLFNGKPLLRQILGVHKAELRRVVAAPELVDYKAVGGVVEKRLFIVRRCEAVFDRLPFGGFHTEDAVKAADFLCIEGHGLGVVRVKHIHAHVPFHELQRTLLCQRQHIGIGVAVGVHALNRNRRVGHFSVVRRCDRLRLLHGDILHRLGGKTLRLPVQPALLADFRVMAVDIRNQGG